MTRTWTKRIPWRLLTVVGAVVVLCVPGVLLATRNTPATAPLSQTDAMTSLDDVTAWAESRHATVALMVVDRVTGGRVGLRPDEPILTASIAKLFIASQLAFLDATGVRIASPDDDALLGRMLSASDDGAATVLWQQLGGPTIVEAVAGRYGLFGTAPPLVLDRWWETRTTAADIAKFYAQLLDEQDAARRSVLVATDLRSSWADRILGPLHAWTDAGADGYDQRFGLPAVFSRDELSAVKQGWMCCVGVQWNHVTTGVFRGLRGGRSVHRGGARRRGCAVPGRLHRSAADVGGDRGRRRECRPRTSDRHRGDSDAVSGRGAGEAGDQIALRRSVRTRSVVGIGHGRGVYEEQAIDGVLLDLPRRSWRGWAPSNDKGRTCRTMRSVFLSRY